MSRDLPLPLKLINGLAGAGHDVANAGPHPFGGDDPLTSFTVHLAPPRLSQFAGSRQGEHHQPQGDQPAALGEMILFEARHHLQQFRQLHPADPVVVRHMGGDDQLARAGGWIVGAQLKVHRMLNNLPHHVIAVSRLLIGAPGHDGGQQAVFNLGPTLDSNSHLAQGREHNVVQLFQHVTTKAGAPGGGVVGESGLRPPHERIWLPVSPAPGAVGSSGCKG
jgi:hypothetical protein